VAPEHEWNSESLIIHLLDEQEKGRPYPKRSNHMKRKRPNEEEEDEQEEMRKKFETAGSSLIGKDRDYFKVYTSTA
jgi:TRIAD3 protein (E3 ubiquitin-protein ligase RNF216)